LADLDLASAAEMNRDEPIDGTFLIAWSVEFDSFNRTQNADKLAILNNLRSRSIEECLCSTVPQNKCLRRHALHDDGPRTEQPTEQAKRSVDHECGA
jgi:hypothetical protein